MKTVDSNVRNPGEVEYDKQNKLQRQKPKLKKVRSEGYLQLPLYINRSVTKKFPIETLSEMIDSSVRSLWEVEYDQQNLLQRQKTQVRPLIVNHGKVRKIHWSHLEHNFAM